MSKGGSGGLDLASGAARLAKGGPCSEQDRTNRPRVVVYRVGAGQEEAAPLPSLGAVCVSETGAPDPWQGCPWAVAVPGPWLGAYSYQGGVMGQQAEVANLS